MNKVYYINEEQIYVTKNSIKGLGNHGKTKTYYTNKKQRYIDMHLKVHVPHNDF